MKKIIISIFFVGLVAVATAQTGPDNMVLTTAELNIKQGLQLSNVQAADFFLLERARDSSFKKMVTDPVLAEGDWSTKLNTLNHAHYLKVAAILNSSQYSLYQKLEEAKKKKMTVSFEKKEINSSHQP